LTNQNYYFICANNCFGNIFDSQNLEKIYIIQNCFDSDFIHKIIQIAENNKYSLEYYLSPTDPNCINGIIIKELQIAIIKNYNYISKYPVIVDNILDFSDIYDESQLMNYKKDIIELTTKKSEYFNLACKFLKSAAELSDNILELSKKYIDQNKLNHFINRMIIKYINEKHFYDMNCINEYKFINSISFAGYFESDIFEHEAKRIFYISNENFLGWYFTKFIADKFPNICKVICPDALDPTKIRAIYLKNPKILFVIKNKTTNKNYSEKYHFINFINMERFVYPNFKKENKQKLKFIHKCHKSIINETVKYLKESEIIKNNIENIYHSSIIPNKKNNITEQFINQIFP